MRTFTVGSLFSGIGGFDLGLERAGFTIRWQCEIDNYCRAVLARHWPSITQYGDITTIDWRTVEPVDVIVGGFPCQPFSVAGKRRGSEDDRYLWPAMLGAIAAIRPTWIIGENVPGIIKLALDTVCADLENLNYTVWPVIIPACSVGAPHRRDRVWILAHSSRNGRESWRPESEGQCGSLCPAGGGASSRTIPDSSSEQAGGLFERRVPTAIGAGCDNGSASTRGTTQSYLGGDVNGLPTRLDRGPQLPQAWRDGTWEADIPRVATGKSNRASRLKSIGNAVVPQIVEEFGRMILATERVHRRS